MLVCVFSSLLKLSENLISISVNDCTYVVIECTSVFRCTVRTLVLDILHVCMSTYHTRLMLERSALVQLIAPLLQSSALAGCYTFARLCSIAWYLCSSASPQSAPTDQKQLRIVFDFFFFVYFSTCLLFHLSAVFNFY